PKTYEKVRDILTSDEPLLCTGRIVDEGEEGRHDYRFLLSEATPLAKARQEKTTRVHIQLNADLVQPAQIQELKAILLAHKGTCAPYIHVKIPPPPETTAPLGDEFSAAPSDELLLRIERLFGDRVAIFR